MKWLLFLFIIECAGTAALKVIQYHSSAKRYFLIGYVANQGNHIFTGGEDTVMKNYPNRNQLVKWLSKKMVLRMCTFCPFRNNIPKTIILFGVGNGKISTHKTTV